MKERWKQLYSRWRYKKMKNNGPNKERKKKKERTLLKMAIVKNEQ